MRETPVARGRSIPKQERPVASGYETLLRRCYGAPIGAQYQALRVLHLLLRKGGLYPSWSSTVAVPFLRGPRCYGSRRETPPAAPRQVDAPAVSYVISMR
jgi:hypothetical protein